MLDIHGFYHERATWIFHLEAGGGFLMKSDVSKGGCQELTVMGEGGRSKFPNFC